MARTEASSTSSPFDRNENSMTSRTVSARLLTRSTSRAKRVCSALPNHLPHFTGRMARINVGSPAESKSRIAASRLASRSLRCEYLCGRLYLAGKVRALATECENRVMIAHTDRIAAPAFRATPEGCSLLHNTVLFRVIRALNPVKSVLDSSLRPTTSAEARDQSLPRTPAGHARLISHYHPLEFKGELGMMDKPCRGGFSGGKNVGLA
jgi:hypothetical protein